MRSFPGIDWGVPVPAGPHRGVEALGFVSPEGHGHGYDATKKKDYLADPEEEYFL